MVELPPEVENCQRSEPWNTAVHRGWEGLKSAEIE